MFLVNILITSVKARVSWPFDEKGSIPSFPSPPHSVVGVCTSESGLKGRYYGGFGAFAVKAVP